MRRISEHVFAELYFLGCNPGFLTTSDGVFMIDTPQQPIDAVRWRERLTEYGRIQHLVKYRTAPRSHPWQRLLPWRRGDRPRAVGRPLHASCANDDRRPDLRNPEDCRPRQR